MKIGVFDSGKGGETVLAAIRKLLPEEEYKYIADTSNCPYGEKSQAELERIVFSVVEQLINWGAKIVVIACNTATTRCIKMLRNKYPAIDFVGTEPAVRLAAKSGAKRILVMATPGTIRSERLHDLVRNEGQFGQKITLLACPGLAEAIEHGKAVDTVLNNILGGVGGDYDCVVLGCTHYPLIRNKISRFFPEAKIVDGNDGVAKRVKSLVFKA